MEVLLLLIVASLLLAGAFLAVFVWATRDGQFEDTTTPALRMLADDPPAAGPDRSISSAPNLNSHERRDL